MNRAAAKTPWLAEDETALLLTALSKGEDAIRHWRRFTALLDFEDIWDGDRYSLLPAVHLALEGASGIPEAPRLAGIHRRTWLANQTALAQCAEIVQVLAEADVASCLHADLAIAATRGADLGARVTGDAELLVADHAVGTALEAVSAAGWRRVDAVPLNTLIDHTDGSLFVRGERDRLRIVWETCRGVADSAADRTLAAEVVQQPDLAATAHGDLPVTPADLLVVHTLCASVGALPERRLRSMWDTARTLTDALADGPAVPAGAAAGAGVRTHGDVDVGEVECVDVEAIVGLVDRLGLGAPAKHTLDTVAAVTGARNEQLTTAVGGLRVSGADRRRHERLVRTSRRRGRVAHLRGAWTRRAIGRSTVRGLGAAPRFLATRWGLRSTAWLPVEMTRRGARAMGDSLKLRTGRSS